MGDNSKITWTTHTFNPWIGCTETSPACDFCYARDLSKRRGWADWGAGAPRHRTGASTWKKPAAWEREAIRTGERPTVFCASLADWKDVEVPDSWHADLEATIDATRHLDWLLLSKRHNAVQKWALAREVKPNVRLGFTIENEEWARIRMPYLGKIALAGWKTFVSYEPALGPINWDLYLNKDGLFGGTVGWLICGGESGDKRREFDLQWAEDARRACANNGVPFFFKQDARRLPGQRGRASDDLWACKQFPEAA